jgi:hypothetical protein
MWFSKKKAPPIRSLVGEGMVVHGDLGFADGLRIDGEVHGDVVATDGRSMLVISEKARVHGKVKAGHVIINGEVRGPVHSDELLELQPKARIHRRRALRIARNAPGRLDRRRTQAAEVRRKARPQARCVERRLTPAPFRTTQRRQERRFHERPCRTHP